tara:strand:- start:97 stop:498 length:402 start_codon:yes stop_codon:yes gene_type:complete
MESMIKSSLLNIIKQDILNELSTEYHQNKYNLSYEIYMEFMKNNIDTELECIQFKTHKQKYISRDIVPQSNYACKARLWNNHKACQCSRKAHVDGYCKIHSKMIQKHGQLRFGTIFDPLPLYDAYTQNKLHWF